MSLCDLWQILMNSVGLWFSTLSNLYHLYQQPKACIKRADASTQLLPVADQHHHKISPGFENLVKYLTFYTYIYIYTFPYIYTYILLYIYIYTIIQYYTYIVIHRWFSSDIARFASCHVLDLCADGQLDEDDGLAVPERPWPWTMEYQITYISIYLYCDLLPI